MKKIAVLPGDGIGPEVVKEGVRVLKTIEKLSEIKFRIEYGLIGGSALDSAGVPLPDETLKLCLNSNAVLLGAIGGPKWDENPPELKPETALLKLRKSLNVYANLRPAKVFQSLIDSSTLKPHIVRNIDLIIVRELTGGIYFGKPKGFSRKDGEEIAFNTMVYSRSEIERVACIAFEISMRRRKKVTSVDKANILEVSQLWRRVVNEVSIKYPDVELEHMYIDNCAMQLVRDPSRFDVILTGNMFGDILSDESAMLTGSIGMLPSASIGGEICLYEPVHGSAPDIAGKNIANPIATILSVAMMLRISFNMEREADLIEKATENVLSRGFRTEDILTEGKQKVSTSEMGNLISDEIKNLFEG